MYILGDIKFRRTQQKW